MSTTNSPLPSSTISLAAPAKVNLNLFVGPALPAGNAKAGYHPIVSLMACIGLNDTVRVTRREVGTGCTLVVRWADDAPRTSPIDWPSERDLALRALRRLERHAGRDLPVGIEIEKRIPVGGGLGGGSSDAAATLVAVDRLFGLGLSSDELLGHAAELGSDVGFFVRCARERSSRAIVRGLGDMIETHPSPRDPGGVVLVLPPFGCETARVYRAFDQRDPGMILAWRTPDLSSRVNMLTFAAERVEPRLTRLLSLIGECAGSDKTWMTGSGSTICVECPGSEGESVSRKIRATLAENATKVSDLAWMAGVACVGVPLM